MSGFLSRAWFEDRKPTNNLKARAPTQSGSRRVREPAMVPGLPIRRRECPFPSEKLIPVRRQGDLTQHGLGFADRNRSMGCLVRIDPNRGDHLKPPRIGHVAATVGTPDHNTGCLWRSPLSSHTMTWGPDGPTVRSKDTHRAPGTSRAKPAETPDATRHPAPQHHHIINQARLCSLRPSPIAD